MVTQTELPLGIAVLVMPKKNPLGGILKLYQMSRFAS
jgi:hypothetical protein